MSSGGSASVEQVVQALDAVAGPRGFRCVPVSWEDVQRGVSSTSGALSCFGPNIADVRLWEKGGRQLWTLRSQNWNERVSLVSSADVAVVVGNEVAGGAGELTPITLRKYLEHASQYAGYAGVATANMSVEPGDDTCGIRFQTVFLPIEDTAAARGVFDAAATKSTIEFCTEVYSYGTHSDADPQNMLVLCTPQGTSVQQDGAGAQKLFYHAVDGSGAVHRYWLEAERSRHAVGAAQSETEAERAEAAARGKATATFIGTRAMGTRFNVQMLVQVPLKQKPRPQPQYDLFGGAGGFGGGVLVPSAAPGGAMMMLCPAPPASFAPQAMPTSSLMAFSATSLRRQSVERSPAPVPVGTSNAARVSRGTLHDRTWGGVANKHAERHPSQRPTITVTMYYTVAGGVPSADDVRLAVADLEQLYEASKHTGHLADAFAASAGLTVQGAQWSGPVFKPAAATAFPS